MRKGYVFAQHIAYNYFTLSPQRLTHGASIASKCNGFIRQVEDIGHRFKRHFALNNIQTLIECRIRLARFAPSFIGQCHHITQGSVG